MLVTKISDNYADKFNIIIGGYLMELKILNNTYHFPNELEKVEELFTFIHDKLSHTEYYFSHLVIDNKEIYDDFDTYVSDHINHIQTVEVVAKTIKEFTNELLLSLEQYLKGAIPELENLTTKMYQTNLNETIDNFTQFLDGVQWINEAISAIDKNQEKPNQWDDVILTIANLNEELKGIEEAIENNDNVLIADILQYEIVPILKELQQYITQIIDCGVKRNDIS